MFRNTSTVDKSVCYDAQMAIEKKDESPKESLSVKATSEMQRKSDIVAGKLTPNGTTKLDSKDVVLRSVADRIIEDVIIEEHDEICEDDIYI